MNVKPGDLAVIIECNDAPENVGLFVEVIAADSPESRFTLLVKDQIWICRAKGHIRYTDIFGQAILMREGPIPDFALRPIRPEPMGTSTETERNLEVIA